MQTFRTAYLTGFLAAFAGAAAAQVPAPAVEPAITLPSVPVAAPVAPPENILPAVPVTAPAPAIGEVLGNISVPAEQPFSYGNIPYSLMYSSDQMTNMKNALTTYETIRRTKGAATEIVVEEEIAPDAAPIVEPPTYPVFTLSSIVYRDSKDWMVWIGGMRITPKINDREIRVISITPNQARFVWKPTYVDILARRQQEGKFASTDALKNKLTQPNTASLDTQGQQVTFTLKPNQSFSSGHMATFEGRIPTPTMEPLVAAGAENAAAASAPATGATATVPAAQPGLAQGSIQRMYERAGGDRNAAPQPSMDSLLQNRQPAATTTTQPAPLSSSGPSASGPTSRD